MPNNLEIHTELANIPGIGKVYKRRLQELEIFTAADLLHFFPRYHQHFRFTTVSDAEVGEFVVLQGTLSKIENRYKGHLTIQRSTFQDSTGRLTLSWFNQPYLARSLQPGRLYQLSGLVSEFLGYKQITHPQISANLSESEDIGQAQLIPIYPQTNGLTSSWARTKIRYLLDHIVHIEDPLPEKIKKKYNLIDKDQALINIHFPSSELDFLKAKRRLSFEELLDLQLSSIKKKPVKGLKAPVIETNHDKLTAFVASLGFTLTPSQNQAINEVLHDLHLSTPMNRLLLGDVGTGKTIVAIVAAYMTFLSKRKTLIMAPTQILANQFYATAKNLLEPVGAIVGLITGKTKEKGEFDVLVGTHALIAKNKTIPETGLIIVDEQHKFGVLQRNKLTGVTSLTPHRLTMSATPIPRTLALTLYGDLNLSKLTDRPAGRKVVKTFIVGEEKRTDAYKWIREQIENNGYQVYIVSPLVEDSESTELQHIKSAKGEYQKITKLFPHQKVGLVHGQLKENEKNRIVDEFRRRELDILVATTVIEVGIDVPDANIMVIESGERFGLAQLHQLRGRVGRSNEQGYCLVFTSSNTPTSQKRLEIFSKTEDGEKLAELDMKLRGPGELYGFSQHGFFKLKIADVWDLELLESTKAAAQEMLANQGNLT